MSTAWQGFYQTPQLKRWLAAMPRRFSCRTFSAPADLSQMTALSYAAQRVCVKGVRIALSEEGADRLVLPLPFFPAFSGFTQFAAVLVDSHLGLPRLCAGLCLEALALEASALGLEGCIMTGNYRREVARPLLRPGEEMVAVFPFGVPEDPEGARNSKRKPLKAFCPDDPTVWPLWAYKAAEALRKAPSAMNRQPWKISYAGQTLSFTPNKMDSVDAGIGVTHLECAAHAIPRAWRFSKDHKSLLMTCEETNEPV